MSLPKPRGLVSTALITFFFGWFAGLLWMGRACWAALSLVSLFAIAVWLAALSVPGNISSDVGRLALAAGLGMLPIAISSELGYDIGVLASPMAQYLSSEIGVLLYCAAVPPCLIARNSISGKRYATFYFIVPSTALVTFTILTIERM